jgi:hypothetical protein
MTWASVARTYVDLFDEVRSHAPKTIPTASAMRRPIASTNLPLPTLDHLVRLSNDTGPAHHAVHTLPDWTYGYRIHDAAAVLLVSAKHHDVFGEETAVRLSETALGLLQVLIGDGTRVADGIDFTRKLLGPASGVSIGKAMWAFGYATSLGPSTLTAPANEFFNRLLPHAKRITEPAGIGYALLGAENYLRHYSGASDVRRYLATNVETLRSLTSEPGWIERWESPDWPLAAQALIIAGGALDDVDMQRHGLGLIDEMREVTSNGRVFFRSGRNPDEEELPITAATFIEALGAAYYAFRDPDVLQPARAAADWFLGNNRIESPMYDFATGGCHDALTASGVNRNQGTEATAYCLLAFLTLHQLAGMETPPIPTAQPDANASSYTRV